MERSDHPQPVHHPDNPFPDRLQYFPADLLAGLLLHRFPGLDERSGHFRGAAELPRLAGRPAHLEQFLGHREVCDRLSGRADAGRLRHCAAAQSRLPLQGSGHDAPAAADDDVAWPWSGFSGSCSTIRPGASSTTCSASAPCLAVRSRRGALRHRHHRHLDVGAVRDAAVACRPVGGSAASLRSSGDRPRRRAGTRSRASPCRWWRRCC